MLAMGCSKFGWKALNNKSKANPFPLSVATGITWESLRWALGEKQNQACSVTSLLHQNLLLQTPSVSKGTGHRTLVQSVPDDNCGRLSFVSQSESLAKSEIKGQVVTCLGREERILCFHHLSPSGIHIALFSLFSCAVMKRNSRCLQAPNLVSQTPSELQSAPYKILGRSSFQI